MLDTTQAPDLDLNPGALTEEQQRRVDIMFPHWFDAAHLRHLPPRHVAYGKLALHGYFSLCGADGGVGKTARVVAMALAKATGRDLLGEGIHGRENVWWYSGEEDDGEMLRRIFAACIVHGIDPVEARECLMIASAKHCASLVVASTRGGRVEVNSSAVDSLIHRIKTHNIGLFIPDPLVKFHRCDENSNGEMDIVCGVLAQIAQAANCAIVAPHHFRKGTSAGGEPDAFRGASAIIDAARAAETLTRMTADEARKLGIDPVETWRYLRISDAKQNLFVPSEEARWLRLTSADLGNAQDGRPSDSVQSVVRWYPPEPLADLSPATEIYILEQISAGTIDGEQWTAAHQAMNSERYAGRVIQEICGNAKSEADAHRMIQAWLRSGMLQQTEYYSHERHANRTCCVVNLQKLADLRKNWQAT